MVTIEQDQAKGRELQDILFELAKSQEMMGDREVYQAMYKRLEALYYIPESTENYRHLYSDIFAALIAIREDPNKGDTEILAQNLGLLRDGYKAQNKYQDGTLIDISESVRKLYDHVSLDVARLSYSDVHKNLSELGEQVSKLQTELHNAQKEQKTLQKQADNLEGKLADTQKEYISILGIFSAVVLAFVGGSMFSSSVLESMGSTNIYRVTFIVDFLAFVLISLIYLLVSFILALNKTPKANDATKKFKDLFSIKTVYLVCFLVALLDIVAWAIDFGKLIDHLTQSCPWLH